MSPRKDLPLLPAETGLNTGIVDDPTSDPLELSAREYTLIGYESLMRTGHQESYRVIKKLHPEHLISVRAKHAAYQRRRRLNPEVQRYERERDVARARERRSDPVFREKERARQALHRRLLRANFEYREHERKIDALRKRIQRLLREVRRRGGTFCDATISKFEKVRREFNSVNPNGNWAQKIYLDSLLEGSLDTKFNTFDHSGIDLVDVKVETTDTDVVGQGNVQLKEEFLNLKIETRHTDFEVIIL